METINAYFKREEFACKCGCGFNTVDVEILRIATRLRTYFNKPLIITSGCRCPHHNTFVHGVPGSLHTKAKAIDFFIKDTPIVVIANKLEEWYPDTLAIGMYTKHIHLGITEVRRRWNGEYLI